MNEMTTPQSEILESLRAITAAATERHAALRNEMEQLEMAFPSLGGRREHVSVSSARQSVRVRRTRQSFTPEQRAAALRQYRALGNNLTAAARALGLKRSTLNNWVRAETPELIGTH